MKFQITNVEAEVVIFSGQTGGSSGPAQKKQKQ